MTSLTERLAEAGCGNADGALENFRAVVKLDPTDAAAYSDRGDAKCLKGDLEGGFADHDKAKKLQL